MKPEAGQKAQRRRTDLHVKCRKRKYEAHNGNLSGKFDPAFHWSMAAHGCNTALADLTFWPLRLSWLLLLSFPERPCLHLT